jgi:magnesium transporter
MDGQASRSDPRPGPDPRPGSGPGPRSGRRSPEIHLVTFRGGRVEEASGEEALEALRSACGEAGKHDGTLWVDLVDPAAHLVHDVASILGIHALIAEDVIEGNQRSKIEVTDGLAHLVVFALEQPRPGTGHNEGREIVTREIDLVLGEGFLLSAHPSGWDPRGGTHFRSGLEPLLKPGPDHLLWAIVDEIVDGYFPFADGLEDLIDRLQDDVVDRPSRGTLERLFGLKRDLIAVRRAVSPVREILNQLTNRELEIISPDEVLYFRDVYDHVIRLADEIDTDRDLVAATVEIYLSTINNNLAVIMKRLTGVTVILAGIGAVAGIFGMSEAGQAFSGAEAGGFWLVTAVVVAFGIVAAAILHRIDWI